MRIHTNKHFPQNLSSSPFSRVTILCALICSTTLYAASQMKVTTWHYNNGRTGANITEKILTPSNVKMSTFGKLFTQLVDGFIVGQPLYLPGVTIPNRGLHNVVYVATMNDTVYAFDADSGSAPLWQTSLLSYSQPGATPVPVSVKGCAKTTKFTQVGVVSTPVIDAAAGYLYLVAETYENAKVVHRLHVLQVTSGHERLGSPVTISASYTHGGVTYPFVDTRQMNRPGLLLANGHVYIAFGSPGCNGGDQGWIMSYSTITLLQDGVFDDEPGGRWAAIWQQGAGISADAAGRIYAESGEGSFSAGVDLPVSVFKLAQGTGKLPLADWFTPYNWQALSMADLDLENAVMILPTQSGLHPYEAIAVGKQGTIYLLDRMNMGHVCSTCTSSDSQIVQEVASAVPNTGSPSFWNHTVYFTGGAYLQAYKVNQGLLVSPPSVVQAAGSGHSFITANSNADGIVWSLSASGVLWARDAQTLQVLYTSRQAANGRDAVPPLAHFATAIEADGKVFIGTQNSLVVYGLLP